MSVSSIRQQGSQPTDDDEEEEEDDDSHTADAVLACQITNYYGQKDVADWHLSS